MKNRAELLDYSNNYNSVKIYRAREIVAQIEWENRIISSRPVGHIKEIGCNGIY